MEALDLLVQAFNTHELPADYEDRLQEIIEECAEGLELVIRFGGGSLYILTQEEDEEDEDFLESARAVTAAKQDDSLFDGTYSQGDVNEIERPEQQLGLISVESESIIDEY